MTQLFRILEVLVSIYSLLCFIRIFITWIPQVSYGKFAQFLSKICDPYLNLFRNVKWLHLGAFDFSPALSLCLLGALTSIFHGLSRGAKLTAGTILSILLQVLWSIISTFFVFFLVIFLVRWIIIIYTKTIYSQNPFINNIDRAISPVVYKLASFFSFGHVPDYKKSLLLSIIAILILLILGGLLFSLLIGFCLSF